MQYQSDSTLLRIQEDSCVTFAGCVNGENLVRENLPFARLSYFKPRPAFTNEWVRPFRSDPPVHVDSVAAECKGKSMTLRFANGAELDLDVNTLPDCIIFTVRELRTNGTTEPATLLFAQIALYTNRESVCLGMALNVETDGSDVPGIIPLLYAKTYSRIALKGCSYAVVATPKSEMRSIMQEITKKYTQDIPWINCAGAFAESAREMQGSYLMNLGDYVPGGAITSQNVDRWIDMLHAIGITQVDFHGAEGKNFSFGDFEPYRKIFPEGRKSLREVIDRLHENGIKAILHTYSAQISTDSSLVTPRPRPELGYNRSFTLSEDIDTNTNHIRINEDTAEISLIHTGHYNSTRYVLWDEEIIEFTALGDHLLDKCIRGAFNTIPAAHRAGTSGHNLKTAYGIFLPDTDGPLFREVAQRTADIFNECDFDAFYFDALEAVRTLEGKEFDYYYATKFVYEVARRLKKAAGMEMSNMYHTLWYVRSRQGAWDRPGRAYKKYLDRHAEVNRIARGKTLLPQNLGWWHLGENCPSKPHMVDRITTDVYEYMGRIGLANDFSLSFQSLTPDMFHECEEVRRFADAIRKYEKLRLSEKLTQEEKERIRDTECLLRENEGLYPSYLPEGIAEFHHGEAKVVLDNPCLAQKPFLLRFEPLHSRSENYTGAENVTYSALEAAINPGLANPDGLESPPPNSSVPLMPTDRFEAIRVITSRSAQGSVALEESPHGNAVRFKAMCRKKIGYARFEQRFEKPLNLVGQYACGVWVHGDGKGEILNFQLRSLLLHGVGLCEKVLVVDFKGWKYFPLIENGTSKVMEHLWPYYHRQLDTEGEFLPVKEEEEGNDWPESMYISYPSPTGNPKHITGGQMPDFSRITVASVWMNNLPMGEPCEVLIANWHSFPTETRSVKALRMGDIRIEGTLVPDSIAEFSNGSWFTAGPQSRPLPITITGMPETLLEGKNTLRLTADVTDGTRLRVVCGVTDKDALVLF